MRRGNGGAAILLLSLVLMLLVGLLDYLTPAELDFGEFYMIPVILVAWMIGRRTGILLAVMAAAVEFAVDTTLRDAAAARPVLVSAWNLIASLLVLAVVAVITDIVYRERQRYRLLDTERAMLLRVLAQELPRPLRAADWFARTFEDAVSVSRVVKAQFAMLRHATQEATFLATDLLALGRLRLGGLSFTLTPTDLRTIVDDAATESPNRPRIIVSAAADQLSAAVDPDRLRHAISSVVARFIEQSPYEPVTILLRASGQEAVIEINSRTRDIAASDIEFAQLLVAGNGGRMVIIPAGSPRGAGVAIYLARWTAAANLAAPTAPVAAPEDAPRA